MYFASSVVCLIVPVRPVFWTEPSGRRHTMAHSSAQSCGSLGTGWQPIVRKHIVSQIATFGKNTRRHNAAIASTPAKVKRRRGNTHVDTCPRGPAFDRTVWVVFAEPDHLFETDLFESEPSCKHIVICWRHQHAPIRVDGRDGHTTRAPNHLAFDCIITFPHLFRWWRLIRPPVSSNIRKKTNPRFSNQIPSIDR